MAFDLNFTLNFNSFHVKTVEDDISITHIHMAAKGGDGELADDVAMKILAKMVKQRKESAAIYNEQNRPELAAEEMAQANVIEEYLPKALSEEELTVVLKEIIARVGASSPKEMGKVMGVASKELAGKADGKVISAKVRELLA